MTEHDAERAAAIGRRIQPHDRAYDREDVAQEAVLLALRGYAIGAGLAVDAVRSLHQWGWGARRKGATIPKHFQLSVCPNVDSHMGQTDAGYMRVDDRDELDWIMGCVAPLFRDRLRARLAGATNMEIAKERGVPQGTIDCQFHRAVKAARMVTANSTLKRIAGEHHSRRTSSGVR